MSCTDETAYTLGQTAIIEGKFYNRATPAVLTDPTTVTLKTINPAGTETSYVYLTNSEVAKVSTGWYTGAIVGNMSGTWEYKWIGTGANAAVIEGTFEVAPSNFSS